MRLDLSDLYFMLAFLPMLDVQDKLVQVLRDRLLYVRTTSTGQRRQIKSRSRDEYLQLAGFDREGTCI